MKRLEIDDVFERIGIESFEEYKDTATDDESTIQNIQTILDHWYEGGERIDCGFTAAELCKRLVEKANEE